MLLVDVRHEEMAVFEGSLCVERDVEGMMFAAFERGFCMTVSVTFSAGDWHW